MMAIRSESNIIALQTWLPDNPEDKPKHSNKKYRFDEHIEYLSYAHMTYLKTVKAKDSISAMRRLERC